jgi:DNA-binding MarR family transcriptional regulator
LSARFEDPLAFQVLNEIGIVAQLAGNRMERLMPPGLSMAGFFVLNHFVRLGGERSPLALARAFQVSKGAMTNTVQRLEAAGWVSVSPDPKDGRAKRVAITEAGRAVREACVARLGPSLAEVETGVGQPRLEALLPELRRLRAWLDANR